MKRFPVFVLIALILLCVVLSTAKKGNNHKKSRKRLPKYIAKSEVKNCHHGVCNATRKYPEKYILKLLSKNDKYANLSGNVIEPAFTMIISNRYGGSEEENMCKTRQVTMNPKSARFLGSKHLTYIVNVKSYKQAVTFETCLPDSPCFPSSEIIGYRTVCKQAFSKIRLLYLTRDGKLEYGPFKIPSTCLCAYT